MATANNDTFTFQIEAVPATFLDDGTSVSTTNLLLNDGGDGLIVSHIDGVSVNGRYESLEQVTGTTFFAHANGNFGFTSDYAETLAYLAEDEEITFLLSYGITNDVGSTDVATLSVTFVGINDAPLLDDVTVRLYAGLTLGSVVGVLEGTDPEGDALIYALQDTAPLDLDSDGTAMLSVDATTGEIIVADPDDVSIFLNDATLDPSATAVASDSVLVTEANLTLARNTLPQADDEFLQVQAGILLNSPPGALVDAASDADGDTLSVVSVNGAAAAVGAWQTLASGLLVRINADGTYAIDARGVTQEIYGEFLVYTLADPYGGEVSAFLDVDVIAPVGVIATDDTYNVVAGEVLTVSAAASGVLANDTAWSGTTLSVTTVEGAAIGSGVALAGGGVVTVAADGTFTFDTGLDFEGLARGTTTDVTFTYEATDQIGYLDSSTVTVTVTGRNHAPTFDETALTFTLLETAPVGTVVGTIGATDADGEAVSYIITSDLDADGDGQQPFVISGSNGSILLNDTGDLDIDVMSTLTVAFEATDGDLATPGTFVVNLEASNNAPVAEDFAATVRSQWPSTGDTLGQLVASDADSDDLVFSLVTPPDTDNDGTPAFTLSGDGVLTVADADEFDAFKVSSVTASYTVTDGVETDTGAIEITLDTVNSLPVVQDVDFVVLENSSTGTVIGNLIATDADGDPFTVQFVDGGNFDVDGDTVPAFGIDAFNRLYVADGDDIDFETISVFTFGVAALDGYGWSETADVDIVLFNVEEAPTIDDASFSIAENSATGTVIGQLSASDPEGGPLEFSLVSGQDIDADDDGTDAIAISTDGIVTVLDADDLDFETMPQIAFEALVADEWDLVDHADVTIDLTDVNDAPVFVGGSYLYDPSALESLVATLTASDPDGDDLTFEILDPVDNDGDTVPLFVVSDAGALETLDLDELSTNHTPYSFRVAVSDGVLETIGTVEVTPNNAPVAEDFAATIPSASAPVGYTIGQLAASDLDGDDLVYSLVTPPDPDNDGTPAFTLSADGVLTVADQNDFDIDEVAVITASYTVSDGIQTDTGAIELTLGPANKAPAVQDGSFTVPEDATTGWDLGQIVASDADGDAFTLDLLPNAGAFDTDGDGVPAFGIDAVTNRLYIADSDDIDYETRPTFDFAVQATDVYGASSSAFMFVLVMDIAEAPTIDDASFTIAETAASGTVIGQLSASDPEGGSLTFSLTSGQNLDADDDGIDAIAISTDGIVTVLDADELDFETTPQITFEAQVTDDWGLVDHADVTIDLTDVNEAPVFDETVLEVVEGAAAGTVIGTVTASDPEGEPLFFRHGPGLFDLNGNGIQAVSVAGDGTVSVLDPGDFDFELGSQAFTVIEASDGVLSILSGITIDITNVDEAPVVPDLALTVDEHTAQGELVGALAGSDPEGEAVTYTLTGFEDADNDGIAAIAVASDGSIRIDDADELDFEANPTLTFTVTASDGTLSETATVTLNLADVNEAPVLADAVFAAGEDAAVGAVLGQLAATDPEDDALVYTLTDAAALDGDSDGIPAFAVATDGTITVADADDIDFETDASPAFSVTVSDGTLTDEAMVTINLADLNETPTLADVVLSADEDAVTGTVIGTLTGVDPEGDPLTYALAQPALVDTDGDGNTAFEVAPDGTITVGDTDDIDFETLASPSFEVTVTDGEFTDTALVTVNLVDVNEAPVLGDAIVAADENLAAGVVIGTLAGSDPEGDGLVYSLVAPLDTDGDNVPAFAINPDGTIVVTDADELDFETNPVFTLTAMVSDGTLTDEATVTINLADLNETPTLADVALSADENAVTGTVIGTLTGIDPEGDPLTYALAQPAFVDTDGDGNTAFEVAPDGTITVGDTDDIDFETLASPAFEVTVTDGEFTDTALVTVDLADVNEAPVLADTILAVDENRPEGALVATLAGSDPEGDGLVYSLVAPLDTDGDNVPAFAINPDGTIVVTDADELDFETNPVLTLTAMVSDGSLTDEATVSINLADLNETPTLADVALSADEDAVAGTVIGTLTGVDPEGDPLTYALAQPAFVDTDGDGNTAFEVAPDGTITVGDTDDIDFETLASPAFEVTVTDGEFTDTALVTVDLADVNEAPVLPAATFSASEDVMTGDVVGQLAGSDPEGGSISYALLEPFDADGDGIGAFTVDADGQILALDTDDIDFETDPVITFTALVWDGVFTTTAPVTVNLTNANDAPFAGPVAFDVTEATAGAVVGQIAASDPDGDPLLFSIVDPAAIDFDGDGLAAFAIAGDGTLTTLDADDVDFEAHPSIAFQVEVSDGGLTTTADVTVNVEDLDEAPVALADSGAVLSNGLLAVPATAGLLANDADPEGGALTVAAVNGSGGIGVPVLLASGALVTVTADGAYTYDPNGAFDDVPEGVETTDSFSYLVSDAAGNETLATATIDITGINHAPVANDDSAATTMNESVLIDILGNDSDLDGEAFALSAVRVEPAHGELAINPDGTVVYTPDAGFVGTDRFAYRLTDGDATSNAAWVHIDVAPPSANAPYLRVSELTIEENQANPNTGNEALGYRLSRAVADPNGDPVTILSGEIDLAASDFSALPADFVPVVEEIGGSPDRVRLATDQFDGLSAGETARLVYAIEASDGTEVSQLALTVLVKGADDAPDARNDTVETGAGTPVVIDVLTNDVDVDGDPVSLAGIANGPAHGEATVLSDGTIAYTPDTGFVGGDSFTYAVTTPDGLTGQATVIVDVLSPSDEPAQTAVAALSVAENAQDGNGAARFVFNLEKAVVDPEGEPVSIVDGSLAFDAAASDLSMLAPDFVLDFSEVGGKNKLAFATDQFDGLDAGETASLVFDYAASDGVNVSSHTLEVEVVGLDAALTSAADDLFT